MQKQLLQIVSLPAIALLLLAACGKDPVAVKTKTQLISQSSWKFEKATASGLGDISTHPLIACYADNVITFSSNLSGTISEGAVVCTSPAPASFTWSFQSNETVLRFSFNLLPGGSPDFNIIALNETNLILSQQVTLPGIPIPTTVEVTFKH